MVRKLNPTSRFGFGRPFDAIVVGDNGVKALHPALYADCATGTIPGVTAPSSTGSASGTSGAGGLLRAPIECLPSHIRNEVTADKLTERTRRLKQIVAYFCEMIGIPDSILNKVAGWEVTEVEIAFRAPESSVQGERSLSLHDLKVHPMHKKYTARPTAPPDQPQPRPPTAFPRAVVRRFAPCPRAWGAGVPAPFTNPYLSPCWRRSAKSSTAANLPPRQPFTIIEAGLRQQSSRSGLRGTAHHLGGRCQWAA